MGVLAWITLLPLFGAGLCMLVPREEEAIHRGIGLLTAIVTFVVSLLILPDFDSAQAGFQLQVDKEWIAPLGIRFHLGIDGISLWLVLLTTFLMPVTLLSPQAIGIHNVRVREFIIAMLVLEDRDDRRVPRARHVRLLRVLGADADPDVLHHRDLGRRTAPVRGDQVRHLHADRLAPHAGGDPLSLLAVARRHRQLQLRLHQPLAPDAARTCRRCSASRRSRWRSRSRCRSSRCTPGCPTLTSRRRPAVR
jgi:hypothetical protein